MQPRERLEAILARSEKAESAKSYVAHMRRETTMLIASQALSQSVHFYAPSMVAFCDAIDKELQELERARKCLLAVMERCEYVIEQSWDGSAQRKQAQQILTIINRELGE